MIFTVTLNPSIDYVVRLDKLTNGITNRTTSEEYYFGGKGINVSCVLAELGLDSTAYGFVAGFTGYRESTSKLKPARKPKSTVRDLTLTTRSLKDCSRKLTESQTATHSLSPEVFQIQCPTTFTSVCSRESAART